MKIELVPASKILSIMIVCLGVIHEIATFTPLVQDGLECLSRSDFNSVIYMSLMCGASLVLSGWLLLLLLPKNVTHTFLAYPILLISIFVLINGIVSVVFMVDNPFAWFVLVSGLLITIISACNYILFTPNDK
ncbi:MULTISPECIES: hypothetical protein [Butyricimonas]|uniref:hypothetical protein n=1 Tax=Butyricimonas TaxID=574697 RepID=UPI000C077F72|nr:MULTISPECIES: hypothetical protein [Butyricimonas]MCB6974331.1 hypothetical protein [Butyricimonas synergistica]MCG4521109.1 hypothetical protein [Butyricimonas sp. DFI.6.44]